MSISYEKINGFQNIYLEDSYVLGIEIRYDIVKFYLDFVLTPEHEFYTPPKEGEQYCYKKGIIIFDKVTKIQWSDIKGILSTDTDGSIDYGNIDTFVFNDGLYILDGDWGNMELEAQSVNIVY